MTRLLGRGMKLSWGLLFVTIVVIVVSNYIHEINSHPVVDKVDICEGTPSQRLQEGQGHMCTLLEKNFVGKD